MNDLPVSPHYRIGIAALATSVLVVLLAACKPQPEVALPANTTAGQPSATGEALREEFSDTQALRELADAVGESYLENSTRLRLEEGLPIKRFEDLTLERYHEDQARTADFRELLSAIDASELSSDDRITFEILQLELEDIGANDDDYRLTFDITPYVAPYTFRFAEQALAAQVIADERSADHYLMLAGELADMIDQFNAKVARQVQRGSTCPNRRCTP